jgi:primase-polymerase (primpol)-like protein
VLSAWKEAPIEFAGIGFVLTDVDTFAGIDLDDWLQNTI